LLHHLFQITLRHALAGGELRYVPSGREPVLHVGSPRGSLYHAKTEYALRGGRPTLPRFLGPEAVAPLVARGAVDLRTEVWPLMAKEIAWGWYHELLYGHPDRVRLDADTFTDRYSAAAWGSPEMVALLTNEQLDMVVGTRKHEAKDAYRGGHVLGNRLFTGLLAGLFGRSFTDIFSGYRAFSRRFVKSFPVLSGGFEIETELTIHALELELPVAEIDTPYYARPKG
jgi:hypothetical protein